MIKSHIIFNGNAGILLLGENNTPIIRDNNIEYQKGTGIKIGIANQAVLENNRITFNVVGIDVQSGDPSIISNIIEENINDGILTRQYLDYRCDATIEKNSI